MPVAFARRTVAGAPLLVATPEGAGGPLPLVLWFPGFRADAEANRAELARLADAGFLAAGVDAVGHGARRDPALDADVARRGALAVMLDLARATAAEVPAIVRALADEGLADPARVAAVGVSMGGYLVYHAVTVVPALRAAVALLGSPEWPDGRGPHREPHAFRDVALLSITAEHDANVPPDAARRFHAALAATYPGAPTAHHELRGAVHLMGADHWAEAMDATLDWLRRHGR